MGFATGFRADPLSGYWLAPFSELLPCIEATSQVNFSACRGPILGCCANDRICNISFPMILLGVIVA
jgi:hypothetical protein